MTAIFAALLVLVPAPANDAAPNCPPPRLQYLKYDGGKFETTRTVTVQVPVQEVVTQVVNGQPQSVVVTKITTQTKTERMELDAQRAIVIGPDGKVMDERAWQKRLSVGAIVLVSGDRNIPDLAYLKMLKEGTLIVVLNPGPNLLPPMPMPEPK